MMRERDGWGLDAAVAVALAVAIFAAWPTAHHYDDGAIYERFVAHAARGEWSTYDATQGPVAGMSGLLHGLAASALARCGVAPLTALRGLNLAGTVLSLFALARLCAEAGRWWRWGLAAVVLVASPALATNLRQCLETPLHAGLSLAGVALAMRGGSPRAVLALAGALVWSKLDAAPLSLLLAGLAGAEEIRERGVARALTAVGLWYVLPVAGYVVATTWAFGSPLPHSAAVKLLVYARREGTPGMLARWLADPTRWALLAAALACGAADARGAWHRYRDPVAALRAALPLAASGCFAAVYAAYAPTEALPWYPALPEVMLAAQVAASAARWLASRRGRRTHAPEVALLVAGALAVPLGAEVRRMVDVADAYAEVPRLVAVARRRAAPGEVLATCAGLAAREWPGPVVDTCGINDRRVPPLRRAGLDPVEVLRPAWVLEAAAGRPGYELVASGYEHTRHGWRAWRLLRRREDAPPLHAMRADSVAEGFARRVAAVELRRIDGSLHVEGPRVRLRLPAGTARVVLGVERLPTAGVLRVAACGRSWRLPVGAATRERRTEAVDVRVACGGAGEAAVTWEGGEAVRVVDPATAGR
jgi:hypothetical protein